MESGEQQRDREQLKPGALYRLGRNREEDNLVWGMLGEREDQGWAPPTEVSRSRRAEHCRPAPRSLWGFQATESALGEAQSLFQRHPLLPRPPDRSLDLPALRN